MTNEQAEGAEAGVTMPELRRPRLRSDADLQQLCGVLGVLARNTETQAQKGKAMTDAKLECAYCGEPADGEWAIHRDGFGVGPEVDLCEACAAYPSPTCEEIWARISQVLS